MNPICTYNCPLVHFNFPRPTLFDFNKNNLWSVASLKWLIQFYDGSLINSRYIAFCRFKCNWFIELNYSHPQLFNCSVTNQYSLTYIAVGPLGMAPHQTFVCSRSFGQFIVRPRASGEFAWHMPDALNGWVDPISLFIEDNNHRFATTKDMIKTFHKQDRCLHLEIGL